MELGVILFYVWFGIFAWTIIVVEVGITLSKGIANANGFLQSFADASADFRRVKCKVGDQIKISVTQRKTQRQSARN